MIMIIHNEMDDAFSLRNLWQWPKSSSVPISEIDGQPTRIVFDLQDWKKHDGLHKPLDLPQSRSNDPQTHHVIISPFSNCII